MSRVCRKHQWIYVGASSPIIIREGYALYFKIYQCEKCFKAKVETVYIGQAVKEKLYVR